MVSEPASHVKPVTEQMFGRVSLGAASEAAPEALQTGGIYIFTIIRKVTRWISTLKRAPTDLAQL